MSFQVLLLTVLGAYLAAGLAFAIPFVVRGVGRVDPVAREAPASFRLVIIPGCAALWPWLLRRWLHAARNSRGDTAP
jgi:hypothetical protein